MSYQNAATPEDVIDTERERRERRLAVKTTALAETDDTSTAMFERLARDPSVDVDKLDRLMQMHERVTKRIAEERFNGAMTAAQTAMRPIATDASNPQTKSRYASYAALDRALRPIYTEHGFGVSYDTGETTLQEHVRVLAYVSHVAGFSRTYHVDMPNDGKGAKGGDVMTKTHATGAAMSYGMRYLLKMIFNVAVGEDDTDGNAPAAPIPPAPDGFRKWWDGMGDVAPEGLERYRAAWKASPQAFVDYAMAHLKDVHEARKVKAQLADKPKGAA